VSVGGTPVARRDAPIRLLRTHGLTSRLDGWAWGAVLVVALFIAMTCWWLSQDRGVPVGDAASHLNTALADHDLLNAGDLLGPLNRPSFYPPVTFVIGALAAFVGGVNVSAPVIGENLVYVSLLAVGCYQTARLVAGPQAGLLAVVFALGSPLLIEQFHVFMLDAPEAALVAISVWLILASERFSRVGISAIAGLCVGLGTASKEQFPLFIIGLLIVVLARSAGSRNRRGIAVFAVVAFVTASPWYLRFLPSLAEYAGAVLPHASAPQGSTPPRFSLANLGWYFWALLNGVLFGPLFAFATIGLAKAFATVLRHRSRASLAPELLGGGLGAWLALTAQPVHDMRYAIPMVPYLAVLGTTWIVSLRPAARRLAALALALASVTATMGATFGIHGQVRILLAGHPIVTDRTLGITPPDEVTIYSDHDFQLAAPRRAGRMLALFRALRKDGITSVVWSLPQAPAGSPVFDFQGLTALARIAHLARPGRFALTHLEPHEALLVRDVALGSAPPCVALADGTGVWVKLGNAAAPDTPDYCPLRRPRFYGP
jgi:hypothetical protein